jgi:hypothetical protein
VIAGNAANSGPDILSFATIDATYSLIGNPSGNFATATPENGNLIGTVGTPLDPKLGALAVNAPGTTATHALLAGSPAIDAGVCTDHEGNDVADDQRGVIRPQGATCDMGAYELEILSTSTTTALSVSPSTQQYSDKVTVAAAILPATATGNVQFKKSVDGGASFADLGSPVDVVAGTASVADHQILQAAGTAVQFKAVFTATGNFTGSTSDATSLTVTKENATILYASAVPLGWASFNGKAAYVKWDAAAGTYVTVGNQSFAVYAEDRNNPGTGIDRIWLGGPGTLAMPGTVATAKNNTAQLTGGGIAARHRAGGKQ